jgi:hypothetical protein
MTHPRALRTPTLLAVVVLSLAAATAPARADGGVGVVVTGEATMQPQLAAQLETWLKSHGHDLVSAPLPPEAINTLIDCFVIEDQSCARRVVEKRAKSAVVFAQVSVTAGDTALDRTVTLTAYWLDKGRDAIAERRQCERCTDVTLRKTADELMAALAGSGSSRGLLKVESTPSGADVLVDGKRVGTTPFEQPLPLGDHRIVVQAPGRTPAARRISLKKGQPAAVEAVLAPKPGRGLAYLAIGTGVAMAVAGGVLFALDEDVPADKTKPDYFDSAPAGIGLAAGGAVVLGVGVFLAVRSGGTSVLKSAPTVSLVRGGGGVFGWAGRF